MEHTQTRSSSKFLSSPRLKTMMAQLLLSLSIFSFLVSYYHSLNSSSLPNYPRNLRHLSTNPFKFSSHAMNKSYIFLICNGLLVFLSKTSGLVRCSPGFDVNDVLQKRSVNGESCLQMYNNLFETKEPFLQKELSAPNVEAKGTEENLNEETKQVSIFIAEEEDDDHDEEEKEEMLSTEELNQKFEEFIRRMKEDIMTNEARTLVIFK